MTPATKRGGFLGGGLVLLLFCLLSAPSERKADKIAGPMPASLPSVFSGPSQEHLATGLSSAPSGAADRKGDDEPSVALTEKLLDAANDLPLAREEVSVTVRGERFLKTYNIKTDDGGHLELRDIPAGFCSVITRHPDFLPDARAVEIPWAGDRADEIEIRLVRGRKVEGRVIDADRKGIARAQIRFFFLEGESPQNAAATADEDGTFQIRGLHEGKWKVAAARQGFEPAALVVEVPSSGFLEIELAEDAGFEVVVTGEDGAPVEGARVAIRSRSGGIAVGQRSALTSVLGRVHLSGVPLSGESAFLLEIEHSDFLTEKRAVKPEELKVGPLAIALKHGGELSGRVTGAGGEPVARAVLRLASLQGKVQRRLRATSSGEFRFTALPPGRYTLAASEPARGISTLKEIQVAPGGSVKNLEVTLQADEAGAAELERAPKAPGSIGGVVMVPGPLTAAVIRAEREDPSPGEPTIERTFRFSSPDLRFRLPGLPPGRYTVSLLSGSEVVASAAAVAVHSGEETGPVRLEGKGP